MQHCNKHKKDFTHGTLFCNSEFKKWDISMIEAQSMYKWRILLSPAHLTDLLPPLLCRATSVYGEGVLEQVKEKWHSLYNNITQSSYSIMECLESEIQVFFFTLLKEGLSGFMPLNITLVNGQWRFFFSFWYSSVKVLLMQKKCITVCTFMIGSNREEYAHKFN